MGHVIWYVWCLSITVHEGRQALIFILVFRFSVSSESETGDTMQEVCKHPIFPPHVITLDHAVRDGEEFPCHSPELLLHPFFEEFDGLLTTACLGLLQEL